jgi:hypothetical protein
VTSVIIHLEFERQNVFTLLYQEPKDDSNTTLIALHEAWNKPKEAEEWREKLPQTEAVTE